MQWKHIPAAQKLGQNSSEVTREVQKKKHAWKHWEPFYRHGWRLAQQIWREARIGVPEIAASWEPAPVDVIAVTGTRKCMSGCERRSVMTAWLLCTHVHIRSGCDWIERK